VEGNRILGAVRRYHIPEEVHHILEAGHHIQEEVHHIPEEGRRWGSRPGEVLRRGSRRGELGSLCHTRPELSAGHPSWGDTRLQGVPVRCRSQPVVRLPPQSQPWQPGAGHQVRIQHRRLVPGGLPGHQGRTPRWLGGEAPRQVGQRRGAAGSLTLM